MRKSSRWKGTEYSYSHAEINVALFEIKVIGSTIMRWLHRSAKLGSLRLVWLDGRLRLHVVNSTSWILCLGGRASQPHERAVSTMVGSFMVQTLGLVLENIEVGLSTFPLYLKVRVEGPFFGHQIQNLTWFACKSPWMKKKRKRNSARGPVRFNLWF